MSKIKVPKGPFTCPHCGYRDTKFQKICPACGRPYIRDYIDMQVHSRDPNPAGNYAGRSWAWAFAIVLLVVISCSVPGCVNSQNTSIKPVDMQCTFLEHASGITDYLSEYTSTSDGTVLYDWKSPALYRMEWINSTNPVTGSLFIMNRTTAVEYNPVEKTYQIEPDMKYLSQHDYQAMVRQIVLNGQYTIIGRDTLDGRTLYGIEVVTEPGSTKYTTYVSSKVQAWIDPESGLAWNITTYYPADTVNNQIWYSRIDVNTGIPDDHFAFIPPEGSAARCGYISGPTEDRITQSPTGQAYLFQAGPTTFPPQQCEPADISKIPPASITVDPINWHGVGESFLITGTTRLPAEQEIFIEVMTEDFMSLKSNPKDIFGQTGTVRSIADPGGVVRWEYLVNTTGWVPDKYLVQVTTLPENGNPHYNGHFYLIRPDEATSIRQLPVSVNPVPYHYDGETFSLTGKTTLPPGQELTISVMPESFLRMNDVETSPGNMSKGIGGKTRVVSSSNGTNHWSLDLNTTGLSPTTYVIDIFSPSGERAGRGFFVLDSNLGRVCRILTVPVTPPLTPSQIPAEATLPKEIVIGSLVCAGLLVLAELKKDKG